MTPEIYCLFI